MLLRKETFELQSDLANYCRGDAFQHDNAVRMERLPQYRRLVFNVVNDTLKRAYPITNEFFSEGLWLELVNDFFRNHKLRHPQVWKMPHDFYEFVEEENYQDKLGYPFLNELLYFEWIEIEVHTMPDAPVPQFKTDGDLLDDRLVVNPEYRMLHLSYPVHKVQAEKLSLHKGDYYIIVYREPENLSVRFFELSPFFTLVFELLAAGEHSGRAALIEAGAIFKIEDENLLIQNGLPFLNDLLAQKIILGFSQ